MNKIKMLSVAVVASAGSNLIFAQAAKPTSPKKAPAKAPATKKMVDKDGYTSLGSGASYKIFKHSQKKKLVLGDYIDLNVAIKAEEQLLQSSRKDYDGEAATMQVALPRNPSDYLAKLLPELAPGDSAVMRILMDTIMANVPAGQQLPPFFIKGHYITFEVAIVGTKTKEAYDKKIEAIKSVMQKKMMDQNGKQIQLEDSLLNDYFKKNNITPKKTASGMYYVIHKEGTGENIKNGQKPSINYTGRLLNGTMFDSNTDPSKNHVTPFEFVVGKGMVIRGWEEGVTLLKKGSTATLYIPSNLGYGAQGAGGDIGPNATLMFDLEVLDVKSAD
jgi:FKBP-type peptidyl-prolyl cis-trans isomerase FkpA